MVVEEVTTKVGKNRDHMDKIETITISMKTNKPKKPNHHHNNILEKSPNNLMNPPLNLRKRHSTKILNNSRNLTRTRRKVRTFLQVLKTFELALYLLSNSFTLNMYT